MLMGHSCSSWIWKDGCKKVLFCEQLETLVNQISSFSPSYCITCPPRWQWLDSFDFSCTTRRWIDGVKNGNPLDAVFCFGFSRQHFWRSNLCRGEWVTAASWIALIILSPVMELIYSWETTKLSPPRYPPGKRPPRYPQKCPYLDIHLGNVPILTFT